MPDGTLDPEAELEVLGLLRAGLKVGALKVVLRRTRLPLKDAKALLDGLQAAVQAARTEALEAAGPLCADDLAEVRALLSDGRKIVAITRVRGATGWGLKECKDFVEAMLPESDVAPAPEAAPVEEVPPLRTCPQLSEEEEAEVRALLADGRKIVAITRVRAATGWGLKESKDLIDGLVAEPSPARPQAPVSAPVPSAAKTVSPDERERARSLVAAGEKLEAIKLVRLVTGWPLKQCKEYVEQL